MQEIVVNLEGHFYAIDNECPHIGASLCEGALDGEAIICSWHGARFNVKTGLY